MERTGEVYRVSGPGVTATGITPKMYDVVTKASWERSSRSTSRNQ